MAKQEVTVVVDAKAVGALRQFIEAKSVRDQIAMALPSHMSAERVIRQAMTLVQTTPGLIECTQPSILRGIIRASELGLELSGPLGQAWLIPRWNGKLKCKEATFQIGYKGAVNLAFRSGLVLSITPRVAREGDEFAFYYGTRHEIAHHPIAPAEAPVTHYYAMAKLVGGGHDFDVWSKDQVLAHRQRHSPAPQGKPDYSAWATSFDAMACKTVLCALARRLPVSVEFQHALAEDAEAVDDPIPLNLPTPKADRGDEILAKLNAPPPAEDYPGDPEPADGEGSS